MSDEKLLLLGVGNQYRSDDAIGIEVVKEIQSLALSGVETFIGGIDGLSLIDVIAKYKQVVIVDAVNMGKKPGEAKLFSPQEAKITIKNDSLSTHGFGIAAVLKLLEQLEIKTTIQIIGVEPQSIDFGEGLSVAVKNAIPEIIELIKKCVTQFLQN